MIRILFCVFISLVCDQEAESLIICRQRKFDPRLIKAYSHSDLPRLSPQEQDMYQVSSCLSKQNKMAINSQRLKTKRKRKGKALTVMDFYRCPRGSRYSALREKCVPRFFGKWLNVLHCCDLEACGWDGPHPHSLHHHWRDSSAYSSTSPLSWYYSWILSVWNTWPGKGLLSSPLFYGNLRAGIEVASLRHTLPYFGVAVQTFYRKLWYHEYDVEQESQDRFWRCC